MTAEEFKAIRRELGLSSAQLAAVLNVNARTIRRWEDGTGLPPNPIAVRVMDWFLRGYRPPEWPEELRGWTRVKKD